MALLQTVSKVYVASKVPKLAETLKCALGDLGGVSVQELKLEQNGGGLAEENQDEIPNIHFLFADPAIVGQVLAHPKCKAKWIQNTFAGVELIYKAVDNMEKVPDVLITRQTSGFGQLMAEYIISQIVARERNYPLMYELQKQKTFGQSQVAVYRGLQEMTIGILGLGTIGTEVARQCKAVNMTVWAALRDKRFNLGETNYEHVHHVRPMSKLSEMLQEVDYLVNILPSTPDTRGLLNGDVLKACQKKKTVFINIGRGDVISDGSLISALQAGWLGGAILDVFNTEPLPNDSPLWTLPGVTITPHVSGVTDIHKAVQTFLDNLERYQTGQSLINRVDLSRGY